MHHAMLLLALVYLDRLTDPDCTEVEHYELDREIALLRHFMIPSDDGYFQAVLDIVNLK